MAPLLALIGLLNMALGLADVVMVGRYDAAGPADAGALDLNYSDRASMLVSM